MRAIATITPAATATPGNAGTQDEAGIFDSINKSFFASLLFGASAGMFDVINKSFSASFSWLFNASEWTPCQRRVDPSFSQDQSGTVSDSESTRSRIRDLE